MPGKEEIKRVFWIKTISSDTNWRILVVFEKAIDKWWQFFVVQVVRYYFAFQ